MGGMERLRTIAATFLVTSGLWIAGLVYWQYQVPQPPAAPAANGAAVAQAEMVSYRPGQPARPAITTIPGGPPLIVPVQGVRPGQLSDTFTQARAGGARVHDAIDILAPRGTPVLAAADGTVEKLFTSAAGGLTVYVRARDPRFIHYYAHLDSYAAGLHEGQPVRQGQVIGTVGSTGNADPAAPHLHFAIQVTTPEGKWYEPSTAINPYPLLTGR